MKSLLLALVCIVVVFANEDDRPLIRCKRPICDHFCRQGTKLDERGCPTCVCIDLCEHHECEGRTRCEVKNGMPTCADVEPIQALPCPIPMCAMDHECEFGFKLTEHGCQTCQCRESPCDTQKCPDGEVCTEHKVKCDRAVCPNQPKCVGKPLCQRQTELRSILMPGPALFGAPRARRASPTTLQCDVNGAFKPLQCAKEAGECWCVDDRGMEIPKTRKVTKESDQPECHYNRTKGVHGSFKLTHSLEDVTPHMNNIKNLAHQHLSNWLHMEEEYVTIVEITPRETNIIQVHFEVMWDEETDMATAVYHVQYLMLKGRCQINYQGGALIPDPQSMDVHHHYMPQLPDESGWTGGNFLHHRDGFMGFVHRHQTGIIAAVFGATMLILIIAIVSFARRRRLNAHFNHRRMDTYKENLAFSNQLYGKQNLVAEDIKEPLSKVEVQPPSVDGKPQDAAPGECVA